MKYNENELIRMGFEESDANNEIKIDEPIYIGDYVTNLTTDELIDIKWNPIEYSDTLCNICADGGDCTDAEMYSHHMELCFDCYSEINE